MDNNEKKYFDYLNGQELDKQEFAKLEKWINISDSKEKRLFQNKKIKDLVIINHLVNLSVSTYNSSKAFNFFNQKRKKGKTRNLYFRKSLNTFLKYAAIFIVIFGVYFFIANRSNSQQLLTVYVPKGENHQIILPDGTNVILNSNSTLKYPSSFSKKKREVQLTGEAFFDVTKNESKPFIINLTSNMNIKVLGTSFNVKAYPEDSKNVTTLFTGKIELTYKNKTTIKSVMLPGNKADFNKTTNTMSISKTNSDNDVLAWKNKMLVFKNESLKDIVNELNRFFDVEIQIKNKSLEDHIFTASFNKGIPLNEILHILEISGNIKFNKKSNKKWELTLLKNKMPMNKNLNKKTKRFSPLKNSNK
jgi:ferric-dicitrate binding protein FerR (iron transport regulator)